MQHIVGLAFTSCYICYTNSIDVNMWLDVSCIIACNVHQLHYCIQLMS